MTVSDWRTDAVHTYELVDTASVSETATLIGKLENSVFNCSALHPVGDLYFRSDLQTCPQSGHIFEAKYQQ